MAGFDFVLPEWLPGAPGIWSELMTRHVCSPPQDDTPATFVSGDLKMNWNGELQSLVNPSHQAALASQDRKGIHQKINALVEFHAPANQDDRIYLWLKSANGHYYYFNYKKGILHVCSDNEQFNQTVRAMKDKDRMMEVRKGMAYELQLTTPDLVGYFTKRAGLN